MGDNEYVGFFMDFSIYKVTEETEKGKLGITYYAKNSGNNGGTFYMENDFETLIFKIIRNRYRENPFYTQFLTAFVKDIKEGH